MYALSSKGVPTLYRSPVEEVSSVSSGSSVARSVIELVNRVDRLLGTMGFQTAPKSLFRNILPISPFDSIFWILLSRYPILKSLGMNILEKGEKKICVRNWYTGLAPHSPAIALIISKESSITLQEIARPC